MNDEGGREGGREEGHKEEGGRLDICSTLQSGWLVCATQSHTRTQKE